MGEHYLKYQKRALQRQLANSPYSGFRQASQNIGRQFGESTTQSMNIMKRQGVPLQQRIAVTQQTQQGYASQMGQQFRDLRQQEMVRQNQISNQLAETNAKLDDIQEQKDNAWKQVLFQVGGAAVGAGAGLLIPGLSPMMGAQIGSGAGQAAGGVATEEWDMALAGVGQTIAGISEAAELKSSRDEATLAGQKLAEIRSAVDAGKLDSATAAMYTQQLSNIMAGGGDVMELLAGFNIGNNSQRAGTLHQNKALPSSPNLEISNDSPDRYIVNKDGNVLDTLTGKTFDALEMNKKGLTFEQQQKIVRSPYNPYSNQ